ncbi:unnamed protein product [Mytilus edulis]|uniref:Reverse transcriptase domain-containing protein n=1 Tax=Mytilus edulis TaxID=6550 RepID=A0A8S3T5K2_MYTED|nr:unnamed protein product [Mytilus edulis]
MNCTLPSGDFLRSVSMANRHFKRAKKTKKAIMKKAFYQKNRKIKIRSLKRKKSIEKAREYVKIFTTEKIKDDEILLLSKGLKYIPSPSTKFAKSSIASDFNEFARKLRCKYHFDKGDIFKRHPFLTKSGYKPELANNAIETYIFKTKVEIDNITINKAHDNLTTLERKAISSLKRNEKIVIRKADKNNTTVIWDKTEYINEGLRQLSSATHFMEIAKLNIIETNQKINTIIFEMHRKGVMDEITFKYLSAKRDLKPGRLYLLPKLHKLDPELIESVQQNPTLYKNVRIQGRPIVSLSGTVLERIGQYLDKFMLPAVLKQETHLRDSLEFINIIEKLQVKPDAYLVSFDIKEMYNNMSHVEMIDAVKHAWPTIIKCKHTILLPPLRYILELLKIVLENNEFMFNGKFYKTSTGVPMGNSLSPEITDLRVYEVLNSIILRTFQHKQKISSLYRFRDDGFFIYNEGTDVEISQFFEHANRQHALLKFTHEKSQTKMQFLDVLVFKGLRFRETGILDLTTFRKKTENYQYLERSSCHPSSTFRGIIKGEMLRFKRCTNDPVDLQTQYALFSERLIKRGYPKNEIKTVMQEVTAKQRIDTLMVKPKSVLQSPPLVFSTVFSRQKSHIKNNILKHWDKLKDDEEAKLLFDKRPLFAFRDKKHLLHTEKFDVAFLNGDDEKEIEWVQSMSTKLKTKYDIQCSILAKDYLNGFPLQRRLGLYLSKFQAVIVTLTKENYKQYEFYITNDMPVRRLNWII